MDVKSYTHWDEYTRARDDMFRYTDIGWAPWYVARTDDMKRGRLSIITHLLDQIPYTPLEAPDIELPRTQAERVRQSPPRGDPDPDALLRPVAGRLRRAVATARSDRRRR